MTPIVSELFLRTQSDERLVSLARTGQNQAFVAIVSRYQRELLVFARRSGPEARAEDVVQQAMLNAFVALRGGTEVTHLRGWLYTIVRRGLAKAAAGEPVAAVDAGAAAITEPLEDVVLRRAQARDTLAAVRGLPSRQRTALIATAFQGQRRSDIARTLGQSEGAVRQLVHRARYNVRNAVGAVMPYPLARWVLPLRGGSRAGAPVAQVAGSSVMDGTVGLVAKFGAVLASGALAAGIVAVPHRAPTARHHAAAASAAAHARHARRGASVPFAPNAVTPTAAVPVLLRKFSPTRSAVRVSAAGRRRGGRAQASGSSGDGRRRGGGGSGGQAKSGSRADGRGPASSVGSGDQGSGNSGSAGSGDGGSSQGGSGDGASSQGGSGDGGGIAPRTAPVRDAHGSSSDGGGSSPGASSEGGSFEGGSSEGGSSGPASSGGSGPRAVTARGGDSGPGGGGSGGRPGGGGSSGSDGGGPSGSDG